jgi:hypothetical protein
LEEAMNRKSIRSGTAAALAGGVIAAAAAATLALASIPDADGVIHGCYKNKTGSLRVVDSGAGAAAARPRWIGTTPRNRAACPDTRSSRASR